MPRETRTAEEIQAEVHRVLHSIPEVRDDGQVITVPAPMLLAAPDEDGCNWYMEFFGNAGGHGQACAVAMNQVRARWNLAA
jgi:hypothetical protein